ncbi:Fc.00g100780.m01.CDS01 [Cosmosporella sp. VM-42]
MGQQTSFNIYVIMPASNREDVSNKRKQAGGLPIDKNTKKKSRTSESQPMKQSLLGPHQSILSELAPKYDALAASVISSTQIRKRVTYIANHLLGGSKLPRVALLYARPADACKLITVVEQCKRVLGEEGKTWYQYNQLFDLPEAPKKRDIVEETVLEREPEDDSESDEFEIMHNRFEDAVLPPPTTRTVKSMRVFLSITPIPELRMKKDVTLQVVEEKRKP